MTEKNILTSFSLLGSGYINGNLTGTPLKFLRVEDGDYIYELVLTDAMHEGEIFPTQERKLFVSKKAGEGVECKAVLEGTSEMGSFPSNRIYLVDVDFNGTKDIMIDNGHFGNQGLVTFTCFLNNGGSYQACKSFSDIANPSIDGQNRTILSTWRNWAASHSWAMYAYDGQEYVMTDCLTEELIPPTETEESEEGVWQDTIEKRIGDEMPVVETFTTEEEDAMD